ncbi:MAG: PAS domain S-box protein, partial [Bacteroidia bacterium]|nr:PAS domain S-box protein [Bacteroidia bacterium]
WSKKSEEIFGWTREEVLSRSMTEWTFVHEEDMPRVRKIVEELINGQTKGNVCFNRNYTKNGEIRECAWYNSIIQDERGHVISILSLIQDVSQQNQQRREFEADLLRRIEFEKLISAVSHIFLNVHSHQFDLGTELILKKIGRYFRADRVVVVLSLSRYTNRVYEWHEPPLNDLQEIVKAYPFGATRWLIRQFKSKNSVIIRQEDDLPPEAQVEKEIWHQIQTPSLTMVPIAYAKNPIGFIGLGALNATKTYNNEQKEALRLIGEIIASALIREKKRTGNPTTQHQPRAPGAGTNPATSEY